MSTKMKTKIYPGYFGRIYSTRLSKKVVKVGGQKFVMSDDPSELKIIINEFSYNLKWF